MRPRWHNDHELLAAVARRLLAQRVEGYPALVDAGRLSPAAADAGIRIMRAVAIGWRLIAAIEPEPEWLGDPEREGAWPFERVASLTIAARSARVAADTSYGDPEAIGFADAVDALLWWETAEPSARWLTDTTRALRAQAAADRGATAAHADQWRQAA
ncbi:MULTISPECIES: hypothetical protein [unclassified Sphingomonas]|uniref:hypothetical protein n=1 Tax=unclassified Sphingomonas TaxID=196159 RepID=UPI002269839F|nr:MULTISPECIES: hypothetical protein [unclassified Sphingomonas]